MMSRRHAAAGFTLLEIMLAMLILGMVVAMVSMSLSGSIRLADGAMDEGEVYYRAQVALERISEDLLSAVLPDDVEFIARQENGSSQNAMLTFASMAHLVFGSEAGVPGLGIISYGVQTDKDNPKQLLLLRADTLHRPLHHDDEKKSGEEVEAFLLADRLRSVKFTFRDQNGEEQESWDTTVKADDPEAKRRLPATVSCRLEFWLNEEQERSIAFQTTVLLPVGLIRPQSQEQ